VSTHLLTQEHGTSQTEGFAQPFGSSQPPQEQLGRSTACTSETTRRGKIVVPTVEKAIAVMEDKKKKMKKLDWQKY
jgi:hypothetical protein